MKLNPAFTAKNLLNDLGLNDPCTVDIEDLILYHNGIVKEVDLPNCDGRMIMKHGRAIVSVSSAIEYPQKRRFVLAHELGHILLHSEQEAILQMMIPHWRVIKKGRKKLRRMTLHPNC